MRAIYVVSCMFDTQVSRVTNKRRDTSGESLDESVYVGDWQAAVLGPFFVCVHVIVLLKNLAEVYAVTQTGKPNPNARQWDSEQCATGDPN